MGLTKSQHLSGQTTIKVKDCFVLCRNSNLDLNLCCKDFMIQLILGIMIKFEFKS